MCSTLSRWPQSLSDTFYRLSIIYQWYIAIIEMFGHKLTRGMKYACRMVCLTYVHLDIHFEALD